MMTRTISTACCRLTARASSRGAVPNTSPATSRARSGCLIQSTKAAMPAWATRPSQDRFSADMLAEPRQPLVHRGHRGGAERAHRPLEPLRSVSGMHPRAGRLAAPPRPPSPLTLPACHASAGYRTRPVTAWPGRARLRMRTRGPPG